MSIDTKRDADWSHLAEVAAVALLLSTPISAHQAPALGRALADALLSAGLGDVTALTAERDVLAAKVAAVEALHDPTRYPHGNWCRLCAGPWPCPTRAVIERAGQEPT